MKIGFISSNYYYHLDNSRSQSKSARVDGQHERCRANDLCQKKPEMALNLPEQKKTY
jgi:hypothetical protein